jgi:putative phosphoribosyl transferase
MRRGRRCGFRVRRPGSAISRMTLRAMTERNISFSAGGTTLQGILTVPEQAQAVVVFAHGSGSSRHSPRNRQVADVLNEAGLATLLIDLLSEQEEQVDWTTGELRFDISLLGERLLAATDWLSRDDEVASLRVGYFGASTGAAAALVAAAERPETGAVVSRGGRPDLAGVALGRVRAPTLLIVGGADPQVLALNEPALEELASVEKALEVVPGATHLFEEPDALDEVARLARDWFERYLSLR